MISSLDEIQSPLIAESETCVYLCITNVAVKRLCSNLVSPTKSAVTHVSLTFLRLTSAKLRLVSFLEQKRFKNEQLTGLSRLTSDWFLVL